MGTACRLLGLLGFISILAPTEAQIPDRTHPNHVINWQVEDGLPQNTIHKIAQTSDGYLWLATTKEVIRFDGLEFRTLASEETSSLDFTGVTCLFGDQSGGLWIGTDRGLFRYLTGVLSQFQAPKGSDLGTISSICESPDGQVYVAAENELFQAQSDRLVSITANAPNAPDTGIAITTDAMSRLWVAWGNTLYRFENDAWSTEAQFPRIINSVGADHDGTIWCGLNAGYIAWLKPGTEPNLRMIGAGSVFEIVRSRRGEILFRISDRLHRFQDGEQVPLLLQNREPVERIQSIFQDREMNLWLATV